jgi:hypothetical protein
MPDVNNTDEASEFNLSKDELGGYQTLSYRLNHQLDRLAEPVDSTYDSYLPHDHLLGGDPLGWNGGGAVSLEENLGNSIEDNSHDWDQLSEEEKIEVNQTTAIDVKEWRLLLEISTGSLGSNPWDYGWRPYFYIREVDLRAGRFENLWVIFDKD